VNLASGLKIFAFFATSLYNAATFCYNGRKVTHHGGSFMRFLRETREGTSFLRLCDDRQEGGYHYNLGY
jgi:hypothetical protein